MFIKQNQKFFSSKNINEDITRIEFLRSVGAFSYLSEPELYWLAKSLKQLSLKAGEVVFKQGDPATKCYLILSGKAEVIFEESGSSKRLAIIEKGSIFGETAILFGTKRNATIKLLEDSCLLALCQEDYLATINSNRKIYNNNLAMQIYRGTPQAKKGIEVYEQIRDDNEKVFILKSTAQNKYHKLSKQGLFIWNQLDGKSSFREIILDFYKEFGIFAPDSIYNVVMDLFLLGFITLGSIKLNLYTPDVPKWRKFLNAMSETKGFSISNPSVDGFITKTYDSFVYILFKKPVVISFIFLILAGITSFFYLSFKIASTDAFDSFNLLHIFPIIAASFIFVALHELGHAYTTKFCGRRVSAFGVGIYWFTPVAFVDTSEMILSSRQNRFKVDIAGMFVDLVILGIISLISIFLFPNQIVIFLWILAVGLFSSILISISPLYDHDGYMALSSILDEPALRKNVMKNFPKGILHNKSDLAFWTITILHMVALALYAIFTQKFVIKFTQTQANMNLFLKNQWLFPALFLALPILKIIFDLYEAKSSSKEYKE